MELRRDYSPREAAGTTLFSRSLQTLQTERHTFRPVSVWLNRMFEYERLTVNPTVSHPSDRSRRLNRRRSLIANFGFSNWRRASAATVPASPVHRISSRDTDQTLIHCYPLLSNSNTHTITLAISKSVRTLLAYSLDTLFDWQQTPFRRWLHTPNCSVCSSSWKAWNCTILEHFYGAFLINFLSFKF